MGLSTLSHRNVTTMSRDHCGADDSGIEAPGVEYPDNAPMRAEVQAAVGFLCEILLKDQFSIETAERFARNLKPLLYDHYRDHWYPMEPLRGSAYRCIRINGKMDPLVLKAAEQCHVPADQLRMAFPLELTIWVDPGEVSVRFGEEGSIGVIYSCAPSRGAGNDSVVVAGNNCTGNSCTPPPLLPHPQQHQQPQQQQHHRPILERLPRQVSSPVVVNHRSNGLMMSSPLSAASTPDDLYSSFAAPGDATPKSCGLPPYSSWSDDLVVGRYACSPVKMRGRCLFQDAAGVPYAAASPVHSPMTPVSPSSATAVPVVVGPCHGQHSELEFAEEPLNQQCKALAERLMLEGGLSSMLMANFNGSPLDTMVGVS